YRDGLPIPATALLTLRFDPERATCPGQQRPDQKPPDRRPTPRVTRHDGQPARRAESWAALSPGAVQPVPWASRRHGRPRAYTDWSSR
ncbi:MAG: hypothetical protein ACREST_02635, partial [Steroidobacteraceae bacterium]